MYLRRAGRGYFCGWVVLPVKSLKTNDKLYISIYISVDVLPSKPVSLVDVMDDLYNYVNPHNGKHSPMISKETLDIVLANKDVCNISPVLKIH